MKNWKETISYINKYSFLTILFSLGFQDIVNIYVIDFWIVTSITNIAFNYKLSKFKINLFSYVSIIFFIATIYLVLRSSDCDYATNYLERRVLFLLIPILISFKFQNNVSLEEVFKTILTGFLFSIIYISVKGIVWIFKEPWLYAQYNSNINEYFQLVLATMKHRSYWGGAGIFAVIALIYLNSCEKDWRKKFLYYLALFYICLFIYMTSARIILGILTIIITISFSTSYWKKNKIFKYTLFPIIIILIIIILYSLPRFSILLGGKIFSFDSSIKVDARQYIWPVCVKIIKENWFSGIGIENISNALVESYNNIEYNEGIINRFEAHNQFLQAWLEGGIMIFFIYFILILIPIIISLKNRNKYSFLMSFPFLLFALVESIFDRISGIILFLVSIIIISLFKTNRTTKEFRNQKNNNFVFLPFLIVEIFFLISIIVSTAIIHKSFDPKKPITYGINKYTEVDASNFGLNNLPENTKGYLLDSSTNFTTNGINAYSYTPIFKSVNISNDSVSVSAWCYISKDCNVDRVGISLGRNDKGYIEQYYNLEKKGEWQLLKIDKSIERGPIAFILSVIDDNATSFKNLNGYVIFAYPNYKFY